MGFDCWHHTWCFKTWTIKLVCLSHKQIEQHKWTFTFLYTCIVNNHRTASKPYIVNELERLAVPYDNLVAQTYYRACNMSGRYNSLHPKFKELAGEENIIFVHCYSHTLNLVLGDTTSASLDVAKLLENLQALYVMLSKSQAIYQLLENCQERMQIPIQSLEHINTFRWSAREYCLNVSETVWFSYAYAWENNYQHSLWCRWNTADYIWNLSSTKQFMASAYLFQEIFAMAVPLSCIL